MPGSPEPTNAREAYQAIIDQLVKEDSEGVAAALVEKEGIYCRSVDSGPFNVLVQSLSKEDRKLLAGMLNEERRGAIHDVLALLTWWINCRDVALSFRGEPMPVELSGMGLHGDYIGRLDGWEWPEEGEDAG